MKSQRTRISAYAIITDDDKILLCRISNALPRWAGQWTLPGGGIDFGETPEKAVIREVAEETGLEVQIDQIIHADSIFDTTGDDDFHGIRLIYQVTVAGGKLRHELDGTTDKVQWLSRQDLADLPMVDLARIGASLAKF